MLTVICVVFVRQKEKLLCTCCIHVINKVQCFWRTLHEWLVTGFNVDINNEAKSVIPGLEDPAMVQYYIAMYAKYFIYRSKFSSLTAFQKCLISTLITENYLAVIYNNKNKFVQKRSTIMRSLR